MCGKLNMTHSVRRKMCPTLHVDYSKKTSNTDHKSNRQNPYKNPPLFKVSSRNPLLIFEGHDKLFMRHQATCGNISKS